MTATVTDAVRSDRLLRSFSMVRETPGRRFEICSGAVNTTLG